ncbi:MAG: STAS domain-containing protein [Flavobacteriales bacterium]|jgi:SulP family sulfate permease|nr:STAS domain-containing protein [Flavobacteriales bacterium]
MKDRHHTGRAGGNGPSEEGFTPKFFSLLRDGISTEQLKKDLIAGIVVGIVALPLAIAFAIASGVSPEKGLITAIIGGLVVSLFGGSRVQIGGPTGAFIIIVFGIVQEYGIEGLTVATFMAGFLIMLMGFLRAGQLLKYFPHTLVVGFTAGIAVVIFSTQVKDLFGLQVAEVPAGFIEKWAVLGAHFGTIDPVATTLGVVSILLSLYLSRLTKVIPGPMAAIVVCTAAVHFMHLPVETIGSRFGAISSSIPMPQFHMVDLATMRELIQPAIAIALLGGIESLLSAVVADGMIGGRHRSNMELVAQGGANVLSSMFGGIPVTGAIARTATNVKNGGRTPISGIVHALTLLVIMLVAAPLAGMVPMACLAGILVVVAWNMGEWSYFRNAIKGNRYDLAVLLVTFGITVLFDLVLAIEVGMVLAAFIFMKRMADVTDLQPAIAEGTGSSTREVDRELKDLPKDIQVFEITGPLFFGAALRFQQVLAEINDKHRIVVLRMKYVPLIDATGVKRLEDMVNGMRSRKRTVYLTDLVPAVLHELEQHPWFTPELHAKDLAEVLRRRNG